MADSQQGGTLTSLFCVFQVVVGDLPAAAALEHASKFPAKRKAHRPQHVLCATCRCEFRGSENFRLCCVGVEWICNDKVNRQLAIRNLFFR